MSAEELDDTSDQLQSLIAKYLEAENRGENIDRDDVVAEHPELARSLREFFAKHDQMKLTADSPTLSSNDVPVLRPEDTPTVAPSQRDQAPKVGSKVRYFGDYELLEEIARGGMGVVYKARQMNLNRIVALKMILAGQFAGQEDVQRFYSEAEAAASLDHPGIVPVFEIGEHADQHYFSMRYIEGESLAQRVVDGPLPPREAAEFVRNICDAMAYAHERGVVHRDLKPANILIDEFGQPKVTDFGLAKKTGADSGLTGTGQILGTPSYMPPEQASGKTEDVGKLADVYSLGAILYYLLTGRPPFQSASPMDTLLQVLEKDPVAPCTLDPKLPVDLNTICLKCLEKDPERRYASVTELSDDVQRYLQGEPITAKPASLTRLARHWIGQNIGAIGWAAVVGALLGLFQSLLTLQTDIAAAINAFGDGLDRLGFARELHPAFSHLPKTPDWLHSVVQIVLIVLLVMGGLIVVALVRPKNRPADVIAGTLAGLAAASTWFLVCLSWANVLGNIENTVQDLVEIERSKSSGELSPRVLARYPELRSADPEKQIQIAWSLARHRQIISAPMGIIQALFTSVLLFVPLCLCETMLAGWLMRKRQSVRAAVFPYMEIGIPVGVILGNFLLHHLLVWLGLYVTSVPFWMSTLLYIPLVAAVIGVIKQIHWPWRVFLHVLWGAAIAATIVQVTNESQGARPVLGVATVINSDVCTIEKVVPGSPAARAGLQTGDVIENVDGQTVWSLGELKQVIQSKRVGATITITYRRDGTHVEQQVELSPMEN